MLLLKLFFAFIQVGIVQCRRWICCYSTDSGTDCQYLRVNDTGRIFRFDHGCRDDAGTDFHQFSNVRRNADCRDSRCPALFDWMYHTILLHLSDPCTFLL